MLHSIAHGICVLHIHALRRLCTYADVIHCRTSFIVDEISHDDVLLDVVDLGPLNLVLLYVSFVTADLILKLALFLEEGSILHELNWDSSVTPQSFGLESTSRPR